MVGSVALFALWCVVYIAACYRHSKVYVGTGPSGNLDENGQDGERPPSARSRYIDEDKGAYIAAEIIWAAIEVACFLYFYTVVSFYAETYDKY